MRILLIKTNEQIMLGARSSMLAKQHCPRRGGRGILCGEATESQRSVFLKGLLTFRSIVKPFLFNLAAVKDKHSHTSMSSRGALVSDIILASKILDLK